MANSTFSLSVGVASGVALGLATSPLIGLAFGAFSSIYAFGISNKDKITADTYSNSDDLDSYLIQDGNGKFHEVYGEFNNYSPKCKETRTERVDIDFSDAMRESAKMEQAINNITKAVRELKDEALFNNRDTIDIDTEIIDTKLLKG
jgi:hypothetical protein